MEAYYASRRKLKAAFYGSETFYLKTCGCSRKVISGLNLSFLKYFHVTKVFACVPPAICFERKFVAGLLIFYVTQFKTLPLKRVSNPLWSGFLQKRLENLWVQVEYLACSKFWTVSAIYTDKQRVNIWVVCWVYVYNRQSNKFLIIHSDRRVSVCAIFVVMIMVMFDICQISKRSK